MPPPRNKRRERHTYTEREGERERVVYIKKKLQKNNLTADSSASISPRDRSTLY